MLIGQKTKIKFYKKCVIILNKKHLTIRKIKLDSNKFFYLSDYNTANLHKESNLFFDWYLLGVLGKKKP